MTTLLNIELKKINLKNQLFSLLLMNIIVLLLSIVTSVLLTDSGSRVTPTGTAVLLTTSELAMLIVRAVLIVWQAILIVQIIIDEYKSKTITVLFTYPFSKKELILAKLLLIFLLTAVFSIFSIMFQSFILFVLSHAFLIITFSSESLYSIVIVLTSNLFLGFFPLFIGMRNRSIIATIISSLVIVVIGSNSQASPTGLLGVPSVSLFLGMISIVFRND